MNIDRTAIASKVKQAMKHSNSLFGAVDKVVCQIIQPKVLAPAKKLTLSKELQNQIDEILSPLLHPDEWKALQLSFAPTPHAIVMLEGLPGTGKTALANYMARKFRREPIRIDFAGVANPKLGGTETNIKETFARANEHDSPVVIMEECDAILWSREKVSEDTMHILGFVNTLLTEIDNFKNRPIPSLLILTTNYPKLLDPAMQSRITDTIVLSAPLGEQAIKMWEMKLPKCILNEICKDGFKFSSLVSTKSTPREMETMILKVCRKALLEKRQPTFADFNLN